MGGSFPGYHISLFLPLNTTKKITNILLKFDIKPAIELARNGWEVFNYTANVMAGDSREWLENPENNWDAYLNENGQIKTAGDLIIDEGE